VAQPEQGSAVVTGSAGGIGAAVVDRLVARGWSVHGWDLREHAPGAADTASVVDITSPDEVEQALQQVPGPLRVFVANAGYAQFGPALDIDDDVWLRTIAVNLSGTFWCMRAAARRMTADGGGSIVAVSSVAADRANSGTSAYAASKSGIEQLAKVLAVELAPAGIRVNVVSPGPTLTPLSDTLTPEGKEARRRAIPLGRFGESEEIANAIAFLAGAEASFVTGTVLRADGGLSAAGVATA
jgi:NAD(P)-dependent dehydrogenase (short-subunit alcohol dehydrogenase family)